MEIAMVRCNTNYRDNRIDDAARQLIAPKTLEKKENQFPPYQGSPLWLSRGKVCPEYHPRSSLTERQQRTRVLERQGQSDPGKADYE